MMNKIKSILIMLAVFSCISQKKVLNNTNYHSTLYIEDNAHVIIFRFNADILEFPYDKSFVRKDKNTILFVGSSQIDEISAGEYHFAFISNKKDTMHITAFIGYNNNYFFDKIKFKKGKYKINYILNDIIYKPKFKGNKLFINNKTFLNTEIVHYSRSYENTKTLPDTVYNDTILLKNLKFSYYDYKQKDFTLIKED